MSRGRGSLGDREWPEAMSLRALPVVDNAAIDFNLEQLRALSKNFLTDLRPGQRKLSPEQAEQIKRVQDFGLILDEEITQLQEQHYGAAIAEAKQVQKEAERKLVKVEKEFEEFKEKIAKSWERYGIEVRYYHHFEMSVYEDISTDADGKWGWKKGPEKEFEPGSEPRPYRDWDYNEHEFDWERMRQAAKHNARNNQELKQERELYNRKRETEEAIHEAKRRAADIEGTTYGQVARTVLSRYREIGGAEAKKLSVAFVSDFAYWNNKLPEHEKERDELNQRRWLRSAERFPTDWLEEMVEHRRRTKKPLRIGALAQTDSAEFNSIVFNDKFAADLISWNGLSFEDFTSECTSKKKERLHSAINHEMVHYFESIKPELGRAGNGYRVWRHQQGKRMDVDYANRDYRRDAQKLIRSSKDEEEKALRLKALTRQLDWRHSEVLSCGIETMSPGNDRDKPCDREHRAFVLAVLALF